MQFYLQADDETAPVEVKTEPMDDTETTENSAAWSILRDDFMIGANMKDWDKQTSGDADDITPLDRDSDDDGDSSDDDDADDGCS